jgi:hypothetical protein
MADADIEMRRTILSVIQKRIDTGVLAAGAGLEDHTAGAAKPKRAYKKKATTVMPEPDASPVSEESPTGGKKKRTHKKKGGSALDVPSLAVTGSTDGGKKPDSAWVKEIKAVQKAKGCTYSDAMKLASAARKAKK